MNIVKRAFKLSYVGKIAICAEQPAGYTCEKWTRYNVCPF